MFLAIDIGNTNITLGVYEGERLRATWRVATVHDRMPDEYGILLSQLLEHKGVPPEGITGVAIASVVPSLTGAFRQVSLDYLHQEPLVVDAGVKTGVRIRYENPREVGADRVVDCAAVQAKYGGPACVVDFGTATTFDAISREGDYLGGAIAPGIGIAAEALFSAGLQALSGGACRPGACHRHQHGDWPCRRASSSATSGWSKAWWRASGRELGDDMKVIATGGLAEVVARETAVIQHVDPWLTLDGLRIVYGMNR